MSWGLSGTLRSDHYVEILAYDTLTHIVEGKFQMFTIKEEAGSWTPPGVSVPNTIAMTEGKFRLEVKHF